MPEIKAHEQLPERPVVVVIFGDPGIGKTSLLFSAENPYLIDFDRGVSRAIMRKDTLAPDNWEEVLAFEQKGTFKNYATIGIDTAKACLDDFLMSYVIKKDFKNQKNKQAAYGALGDEFKVFVNNRRSDRADLVILAHSKDKEDGDFTKKIPDVTGGSFQLLLRIADQIGYMTMRNNKRTIQFEPTDNSIGKNVARLDLLEIPEENTPELKNFLATVINMVKRSITRHSEEQETALNQMQQYYQLIEDCETPDQLTDILTTANTLSDYFKLPMKKLIGAKSVAKGWLANKETKRYELAPVKTDPPADKKVDPPAPAGKPSIADTPANSGELDTMGFDERCQVLADAGMAQEIDRLVFDKTIVTYDQLREMTEDKFNQLAVDITIAAKKAKRKLNAKQTA